MMAQETPKARGSKHLTLGVMRLSRKVGVCLRPVSLWTTLKLTSTKGGYGLLVHRCDPPQESHGLVGVCALIRRISVTSVLVRTLCVILGAANHGRSFHRPRPPRYLPDLTLYEPSLLTALGKFPIEPLKALLLDIQPPREEVEAFEGSMLEPVLKFAIPGFSSPPQRQGHRTLLLDGLPRTQEFFGGHAKSPSQLTDGAKVRTSDLASLDRRDGSGTYSSLPSQPRLGPHPQPTDILHSLAYVGHACTSSLTTNESIPQTVSKLYCYCMWPEKSGNFLVKKWLKLYERVYNGRAVGSLVPG